MSSENAISRFTPRHSPRVAPLVRRAWIEVTLETNKARMRLCMAGARTRTTHGAGYSVQTRFGRTIQKGWPPGIRTRNGPANRLMSRSCRVTCKFNQTNVITTANIQSFNATVPYPRSIEKRKRFIHLTYFKKDLNTSKKRRRGVSPFRCVKNGFNMMKWGLPVLQHRKWLQRDDEGFPPACHEEEEDAEKAVLTRQQSAAGGFVASAVE